MIIHETTITNGDCDASAENILRALRARFDAMIGDDRDSYVEKARQMLPPSYHNDKNIVLATALEILYHDESLKGTLV